MLQQGRLCTRLVVKQRFKPLRRRHAQIRLQAVGHIAAQAFAQVQAVVHREMFIVRCGCLAAHAPERLLDGEQARGTGFVQLVG